MNTIKKILLIITILALCLAPALVFAGNNDSLPSNPWKGGQQATDLWNYSSQYEGIRLSIYWAPDIGSFETGQNVILVGKKTDITKTGPRFKVERYTDYSVYDYMNGDSRGVGAEYSPKQNTSTSPYTYVDRNDSPIVAAMPSVFKGTKQEWDNWFESPDARGVKTYKNIPEIARLVGAQITSDDFINGFYSYEGERLKGQYKIFFEPIIYPCINGFDMVMTLRDAIRWEEAFVAGRITTAEGRRISAYCAQIFTYLANSQFLIAPEPAISMVANSPVYKVEYDGTQADRDELRRQIAKGGKIYKAMGVGVITPEPREPRADFDIIYNYETVTDKVVETSTPAGQQQEVLLYHRLINSFVSPYKQEDIDKIEYFTLDSASVPDDLAVPGTLAATVPGDAISARIPVTVGAGAGQKTVIGMKIYFTDGAVYPSGIGTLYRDKYVIHDVTMKNVNNQMYDISVFSDWTMYTDTQKQTKPNDKYNFTCWISHQNITESDEFLIEVHSYDADPTTGITKVIHPIKHVSLSPTNPVAWFTFVTNKDPIEAVVYRKGKEREVFKNDETFKRQFWNGYTRTYNGQTYYYYWYYYDQADGQCMPGVPYIQKWPEALQNSWYSRFGCRNAFDWEFELSRP